MEEGLLHGLSRDTVRHDGEVVVWQDCGQPGHTAFSQEAESVQEVGLSNKTSSPSPHHDGLCP